MNEQQNQLNSIPSNQPMNTNQGAIPTTPIMTQAPVTPVVSGSAEANTQINPIAPNEQATPVVPVENPASIISPAPVAVEPNMESQQSTSGDDITFDYNQLYANQITATPTQAQAENNTPEISALQETPIVFAEEKKNDQTTVKNVIPAFDTRALEDNLDDETVQTNEQLINSIKSESQQEKDQYKKNLIFILVFFGILVVAVWFIFPLIAGYK